MKNSDYIPTLPIIPLVSLIMHYAKLSWTRLQIYFHVTNIRLSERLSWNSLAMWNRRVYHICT